MNGEKIACFPYVGDYHLIIRILIERCLHYKTMTCPPTTKRTVEIGSRNSPDMVCTPFKITLGNFIEAVEKGANVLVMPGAGCRLGFYDILQKQILSDMGYDIEMLPLFDYAPNVNRLYKSLNGANPDLTLEEFNEVFELVIRITIDMDRLADFMRMNIAFEETKGELNKLYIAYLHEVHSARNAAEAEAIGIKYESLMHSVKLQRPDKPVRIGIIGEMYAVMEPSLNCHIEKWLAEHGIEIHRPIDLTRTAAAVFTMDEQIAKSGGYVKYNVGSFANDTITHAYEMANSGIDGIIHIKPSTCSPEITAMSILQNISRDFNVPIIYLTFDTETSEAGLYTRLEAFHDMLTMRRQ